MHKAERFEDPNCSHPVRTATCNTLPIEAVADLLPEDQKPKLPAFGSESLAVNFTKRSPGTSKARGSDS